MKSETSLPTFDFEKKLWHEGYGFVAGADEVGRGAFSGPLVAGAVIFPPQTRNLVGLNDSKKLRPKVREEASLWIKNKALAWGLGEVSATLIDRIGIVRAYRIAFRSAVYSLTPKPDYLLIDAFYIPYLKGVRRNRQKAIIRGDQKSATIAAASIIAKVYRDDLMRKMGRLRKYQVYGWGRNKGYGTREHRKALVNHGSTKLHRQSFLKQYFFSSRVQSGI